MDGAVLGDAIFGFERPWSEVKWFWLQFVIVPWPWNMPVIRYEETVTLLSLPCASQ